MAGGGAVYSTSYWAAMISRYPGEKQGHSLVLRRTVVVNILNCHELGHRAVRTLDNTLIW